MKRILGLIAIGIMALAVALLAYEIDIALAATAGPFNPSANSEDTSNGGLQSVANPTNAYASDNVYTGVTSNTSNTNYRVFTGFGITGTDIPVGSTINGILVEIEANRTGPAGVLNSIKMSKALTLVGTAKGSQALTATDTYYPFGGSADLWGTTWAQTDIVDTGFGVAVSYNNLAMGGCRIDHIRITVDFTAPAGGDGSVTRSAGKSIIIQ